MRIHVRSPRRVLLGLALFVMFFSLHAPRAFGQFNGSISGTVSDSTGAVIPGAKITLKSDATQAMRQATSSSQGFYQFGELPPGSYTVTVEAANFKTQTYSNINVAAETPRSLDAHLTTGGASETVTVNGNAIPLLQSADANISSTIDAQQIQRLPAVGRDPYELLRLSVGIVGDGARSGGAGSAGYLPNAAAGGVGQSNYGIFQTENQVQISAAGQRGTSNTYLLDGVSVDSLSHGGAAVITPTQESVQQITVTATSFDAQYGRNVGAQVQTVTKSGSNQFHATGSFLYDEPGLNAYNSYGGPDQALPYRNQNKARTYALGIGGPIIKDKLFFFLSYEGFTQQNISYGNQWVETPEFRQLVQQSRPGSIAAAIASSAGVAPRVRQVLSAPGCSLYDTPQFNNNPSAYCQQLPGGGLDIGSPVGGTGTYVPIGTVPNSNIGNAYLGGGFDGRARRAVISITHALIIS
jgi:hypothetical protein